MTAKPVPTPEQIEELLAIDDVFMRAVIGHQRYGKAHMNHIDAYLGGGYLPPRASFQYPPTTEREV